MTAAAPIEYVNRFRPSQAEIDRRYANTRKAMAEHGIDYLVVSGSEYSGFEGAVEGIQERPHVRYVGSVSTEEALKLTAASDLVTAMMDPANPTDPPVIPQGTLYLGYDQTPQAFNAAGAVQSGGVLELPNHSLQTGDLVTYNVLSGTAEQVPLDRTALGSAAG